MTKKIGVLIRLDNDEERNSFYQQIAYINDLEPLLLIETYPYEKMKALLAKCDGLVITGGTKKGQYDDLFIEEALTRSLPLLGVCQGMQSMAIYQSDLQIEEIGSDTHHQPEGFIHQVHLQDSRLKEIVGVEQFSVNSHHYQTVRDSKVFSKVGYSDDGLIEVVENSKHSFQIGVQWHPERMLSYDEVSCKIIKAFGEAVKKGDI